MEKIEIIFLIVIALLGIATPAMAIGLEMMGQCVAKNDAENLCIEQGGCPKTGYCYFPDGSYYLVWSLYHWPCEGCDNWALSDQNTWAIDAYRFLGSSDCFA